VFQEKREIPMEDKRKRKPFDGTAWFDRQVSIRTRAALDERGSTAKSSSREYKTEYARQVKLFRAERAIIKQRKKEKHIAKSKKRMAADHLDV
jgi:hypothetical protein